MKNAAAFAEPCQILHQPKPSPKHNTARHENFQIKPIKPQHHLSTRSSEPPPLNPKLTKNSSNDQQRPINSRGALGSIHATERSAGSSSGTDVVNTPSRRTVLEAAPAESSPLPNLTSLLGRVPRRLGRVTTYCRETPPVEGREGQANVAPEN